MTPPVDGADFLAALVASCFLGALPPVDFLAVCLVRAMAEIETFGFGLLGPTRAKLELNELELEMGWGKEEEVAEN